MTGKEIPFPWNYIGMPKLFKFIHCDNVDATESGFKHSIAIDIWKGLTLPFCVWMAYRYNNFSPTMMTYTAMHGTYGILWVLKSFLFPDPKWERRVPWSQGVVVSGLGIFWTTPWLISSKNISHSPPYLAFWIMTYTLGVFLHFGADMQKTVCLQLRPGVLITDKFFALVRHPNYLGEFLIYSAFVMLGDNWSMPLFFLSFVCLYWIPNMWWKEKSMSRYEEWKSYASKVYAFIPFVF
jgi:protein-S-isoprenylcysteine O-methyltransferase Ste14